MSRPSRSNTKTIRLASCRTYTAHYVRHDIDEGPIVEQDVTRFTHAMTVEDGCERGAFVERSVSVPGCNMTHRRPCHPALQPGDGVGLA